MSALFDLAAGLARTAFQPPAVTGDREKPSAPKGGVSGDFFTEDGERVTTYEPVIVVEETALSPSGHRLACGESRYVLCDGDVFEAGVLTITSMDTGATHRTYAPGQWVRAVAYDRFGHISYVKEGELL